MTTQQIRMCFSTFRLECVGVLFMHTELYNEYHVFYYLGRQCGQVCSKGGPKILWAWAKNADPTKVPDSKRYYQFFS